MQAAVFDRYGNNDVLAVRDAPRPAVGPQDVLVRVRAASVNPLDWKVREGQAKIFTGRRFPKVLGSECAGEVVETGSRVTGVRAGDAVILLAGVRRPGAFAEYACAKAATVYPKDPQIDFERAACLPIAGLTALQSLRYHGKIASGMQVLINGASGGVGHLAVQIAKLLDAHTTAVCSERNREFVRELGADRIIDYTREDFARGPERYDLIFDTVSTRSYRECKGVLTSRGIYVCTLPNRVIVDQIITTLLPGRKAISMWVRPNAADMAWLQARTAAGKIRVVIERSYPLSRAVEAVAYSESGRVRGKIVITMND